MKKSLVIIVLLAVGIAAAQTTPPPQQPSAPPSGTQQPPTPPAAPQTQPAAPQTPAQPMQPPQTCGPAAGPIQVPPPTKAPTIQDPGEYQAYINAIQATDPRAKISALEGFVRQYPNSVVKTDALDQLIAAYQGAGDAAKMQDAAQRLLQADPNSVRALALLAYLDRAMIQAGQVPAGQAQQMAAQAAQYAQRGLEALPKMPRPEGMTEEQYTKLANDARAVFQGVLGFGALQTKNYAQAQGCLTIASQGAPDFYNIYQLALAYLEPSPPNPLGFWYIAKAIALAPGAAPVADYGTRKYRRFHGGDDGWQDILNQAKSTQSTAPPPGFRVAPAPSPAEVAAKIATKPVKDMSLDEIQLILTYGTQQTAAQVWDQVKGKPLGVGGAKLVGISETQAQIAALSDDMDANPPKPDVTLAFAKPLPAKVAPPAGAAVDFQGTPVSYTPNPFMLQMESGCLIKNNKCISAAPTPPPRKGPAGKKKKTG